MIPFRGDARPPRVGGGWSGGPPTADAVDQLCLELTEVCNSAVDPFEIAAALEAEAGLTSRVSRARYGFPDVFALAEEMYRRTSCLPAEPEPQPDPCNVGIGAHVLHAMVYGLSALGYVIVAPMLQDIAELTVVLVSMLTSWMLGRGLAALGYARLARSDPGGAARLLRAGLWPSAFVLLVAVAVAAPPASVAAFAVAQGVFLLGATVLLVLRAERWMLVALAPGVVGTGYLLLEQPERLAALAWLPPAGSALLAVGFAVAQTANPAPGVRVSLLGAELRAALPHALFGLVVAALLALPVTVTGLGQGPVVSVAVLLILPLSLSMGVAQWSVYRYRRQVRVLLRTSRTARRFAPKARLLVLTAVTRYAVATALLIAATLAVVSGTGSADPGWTALGTGMSSLVLGAALFVAVLLQEVRGGLITVLACATALTFEAALVLGLPPARAGLLSDVGTAQLLAGSILFVGLLVRSWAVLGRVDTHA